MAIRMIGLDLDGTLLNSNKELTARTRAVLQEAAARGIVVVPATGRPLVGLSEEIRTLPGVRYAVVTNGAAVCDLQTGERLHRDCMAVEDAAEILRRTRRLRVVQGVFVGDWGYMEAIDRCRVAELSLAEQMKQYIVASRHVVEDLPSYLRERGEAPEKTVLMFLRTPEGGLFDYDEAIAVVREYPEVQFVSGGVGNIEITHKTAGKGAALLMLGKKLGIAREELMAVGDSGNDLDMIEKAGLGVAMANSEAALLEKADAVTCSNDEDGVAAAIEKFVFGT